MLNLVSLTQPSLQILGKTQTGVFLNSGQSLTRENCHNSRTGDDIDTELGQVTNIDKMIRATKQRPKN